MSKYAMCKLSVITRKGCPACDYLKKEVLPQDDVGVDHIDIQTPEQFEDVFAKYPEVTHVPTLVIECDDEKPQFISGVDKIASILKGD